MRHGGGNGSKACSGPASRVRSPTKDAHDEDSDVQLPKAPKQGVRPVPGRYGDDEDETKELLRKSQAKAKAKANGDGSSSDPGDEPVHIPAQKRVQWDDSVQQLGESPVAKKRKAVQRRPAAADDDDDDSGDESGAAADDDSSDEAAHKRQTPAKQPKGKDAKKTKTPEKASRFVRIPVPNPAWEARWKTFLKTCPKDLLPKTAHGEQTWSISDHNEKTTIQVLAKDKCLFVSKARGWKGSKRVNVSRDYNGDLAKAWSEIKKKVRWNKD